MLCVNRRRLAHFVGGSPLAVPIGAHSEGAVAVAAGRYLAQVAAMKHLIFDGHNDVLTKLDQAGGPDAAQMFLDGLAGQLDAKKARTGGFGGGFFAMWTRSEEPLDGIAALTRTTPYDVPMPPEVPQSEAWQMIRRQAATFHRLTELDALRLCTRVSDITRAREDGVIAAILHLEGAEAIGPDLTELDELYSQGLRSLGPVWSRPNPFGTGVPFRYPSDGDIGPGLTAAGRNLVERCGELRILVDLSHLNVAGFWDVAAISKAPLVATHSNAHAVAPNARNLTDRQLAAIAETGGLVGLNFEVTFLRPDGLPDDAVPAETVMAQLDHLLDQLGEDGVTVGSDYDGCTPPRWLNSADKLPALVAAMDNHGYGATRIEKICWKNWMRVLRDTWDE